MDYRKCQSFVINDLVRYGKWEPPSHAKGVNGDSQGCRAQDRHPGNRIITSRAPRWAHGGERYNAALRAPLQGANGCRSPTRVRPSSAPFAFTVGPVGAEEDDADARRKKRRDGRE